MKLNVNFDSLNAAVQQMGAKLTDFTVHTTFDTIDIDIGGTDGLSINIKDIMVNFDGGGLLEYKGRQILLFIPEQYNIDSAIENYSRGNKFHIADCKTLQEMREKNKYNKYAVTNNLSGIFTISGFSNSKNKKIKVKSPLSVCKNCLDKLNYKNYSTDKFKVFNNFKINEFFETYSVLFDYLPNLKTENSDNEKSKTIEPPRKRKFYICKTCQTDFSSSKELLSNDSKETVCLDCYRKEKKHNTTLISQPQIQELYGLRTKQNKITISTWNDVYKYIDISLHSYIHRIKAHPRYKNHPPTSAGYIPIENTNIILDLVWIKNNKKSALVTKKLEEHKKLTNWTIYTLGEAMNSLQQG